ncbi:MAG: hypothetical protein AAGM38_15195 [Pseudomonadota bacterium]
MKVVADTLGVARSPLSKRLSDSNTARKRFNSKAEDAPLLARNQRLVGARPTCEYRRITALLSREWAVAGEAFANHKRVCRRMKAHGLLLARNSGHSPGPH